ncbi:MAG TPA: hypothetical protein VJV78_18150 [Polyangiales bacterium]|nr:hypothetical protein [Polyangiales bacterium]
MTRIATLICLLGSVSCSRTTADSTKPSPSPSEESGAARKLDTSQGSPPRPEIESNNVQCAALMAEYQQDRNSLLSGDRTTLRERLTELGQAYSDRMKRIPICSFHIL